LVQSADATLSLAKSTLDKSSLARPLDKAIASGDVKVDGRKEATSEVAGMLDNYPFWFNIVTP
jgi:alkyl sulfatase BDS1-like metallo-beta-lactamase superfamily hydrolase